MDPCRCYEYRLPDSQNTQHSWPNEDPTTSLVPFLSSHRSPKPDLLQALLTLITANLRESVAVPAEAESEKSSAHEQEARLQALIADDSLHAKYFAERHVIDVLLDFSTARMDATQVGYRRLAMSSMLPGYLTRIGKSLFTCKTQEMLSRERLGARVRGLGLCSNLAWPHTTSGQLKKLVSDC